MSPRPGPVHIAVALDGAGWHPAAWREPRAAAGADLFGASYWISLVQEAERGLLDFVSIEDSLARQPAPADVADDRTDRVRGRLDAVLVAARVAPLTTHIGLVPTAVVTHTEPFHLSKAIATLDYISAGRAGLQVQVSTGREEAALFGRRTVPPVLPADLSGRSADPVVAHAVADLFDEAADYVEAVRRLWDSWEDDAEIRDTATGRFVDREKLHYIDFVGGHFSVKGPSITPRPPQGQPVVTTVADATLPYRLGARVADVLDVTVRDTAGTRAAVAEIRSELAAAGRAADPVHVFGDIVVFLDGDAGTAAARLARLDDLAGTATARDPAVFAGTPAALADLLAEQQEAGLSGFRLHPGTLPHDLESVTRLLVPELQHRRAFHQSYESATLRGHLGLPRPASRYAHV